MKYSVGDLLLIKDIEYNAQFQLRPRLRHRRIRPRPCDYLRHELFNSYGIVTEAIKHSDLFEKGSTEKDNGYVWFSQIDSKEYYFYEDEVIGEVVE
jgi:hypothetical protein